LLLVVEEEGRIKGDETTEGFVNEYNATKIV